MGKASNPGSNSPDGAKPAEAREGGSRREKTSGAGEEGSPQIPAGLRPLGAREQQILDLARKGMLPNPSDRRPDSGSEDVIRGSFIRWVAVHGGAFGFKESPLLISGVRVTETLDLTSCHVVPSLFFFNCIFEKEIIARNARIPELYFVGCTIRGMFAENIQVAGNLFFRDDSRCFGQMRIIGGSIGGNLDLSASRFFAYQGDCITADRLRLEGSFFLNKNTKCVGSVRVVNARINGTFVCKSSAIINQQGYTLTADGLNVRGDAFLSGGFKSKGCIRMPGVIVGGDLDFNNSALSNEDDIALAVQNARIAGNFIWTRVTVRGGAVSLTSSEINALVDDASSWFEPDHLVLDGFRYDRISGVTSPTSAEFRIRWLRRQDSRRYGVVFWPQPWEHAAKILREMGHSEDAKQILMEKQRELRMLGLVGPRPNRPPKASPIAVLTYLLLVLAKAISRLSHRLYGALAGYGFRPMRTLGWMIAMWAFATAVYAWGEGRGLFAPRATGLLTDIRVSECGKPPARWTRCPELPAGYNTFDAPMYSLDTILPLVDLKQEADWAPVLRRGPGWAAWDGLIVRGTMWAEILFGWITSLLLVSAVSRLMQKD